MGLVGLAQAQDRADSNDHVGHDQEPHMPSGLGGEGVNVRHAAFSVAEYEW